MQHTADVLVQLLQKTRGLAEGLDFTIVQKMDQFHLDISWVINTSYSSLCSAIKKWLYKKGGIS